MSFAKPTFKQDILTDIFGSSLGNDKSTTFTPQKTVSDMIDLILPWDADHECFRSTDQTFSEKLNNGGSYKYLSIADKSGRFPLEIYNRLMLTKELTDKFPDKAARRDYILKNMIYVNSLNYECALIAMRMLYGNIITQGNVRCLDRKIYTYVGRGADYCKALNFKNENGEIIMRFDYVIGNPPYQESDGSGLDGGSALYDKFIKLAEKISDKQVFIVPMRWMVQYDVKGIDNNWVYSELHSNKFVKLRYTEDSYDIFDGVNIRGGVAYYLRDISYNGKCNVMNIQTMHSEDRFLAYKNNIDIFIKNNIENSILEKVYSENSFDTIIGATNEFGIESNTLTYGKGIKLYRSFGKIDECGLSDIKRGSQYIGIYKTIIGRTFGKGMKGERLPEPRVIGPNEIYTGSLISLCKSKDVNYCQNVAEYAQTKFVALLVGLRKSTHNATRAAYKFVPM